MDSKSRETRVDGLVNVLMSEDSDFNRYICAKYRYADCSLHNVYKYLNAHYPFDKQEPVIPASRARQHYRTLADYFETKMPSTLRPLFLEEAISTLKPNTSPCGHWNLRGYMSKLDVVGSKGFLAYMVDLILKIVTGAEVRLFLSFSLKDEIRSCKEGVVKDTRLFTGVPVELVLIESMFVKPVEDVLIKLAKSVSIRGWSVGVTKYHGGWHLLGCIVKARKYRMSFDVSKMDATTLALFLNLGLWVFFEMHQRRAPALMPYAALYRFLVSNLTRKLVLSPDGNLLQLLFSNSSGRRGTTAINTVNAIVPMIDLFDRVHKVNVLVDSQTDLFVYGDNILLATDREISCDQVIAAYRDYSYTLKLISDDNGVVPLEFLSHAFSRQKIGVDEYWLPVPVDPLKRLAVLYLCKRNEFLTPLSLFHVAAGLRVDSYWDHFVRFKLEAFMHRAAAMDPVVASSMSEFVSHSQLLRLYLGPFLSG